MANKYGLTLYVFSSVGAANPAAWRPCDSEENRTPNPDFPSCTVPWWRDAAIYRTQWVTPLAVVHFVYRHRGVRSGAPRLGADPTPGFLRWRCCDRAPERGTRLSRKAVPAHRARSVHPGAVREERGVRAFPPGAPVDYEDTPLAEHVLRPVRADYEPCLPGLLVPWPLPRSETAPSGCDFRRCEPATESRIGGPVPQSRPAPHGSTRDVSCSVVVRRLRRGPEGVGRLPPAFLYGSWRALRDFRGR